MPTLTLTTPYFSLYEVVEGVYAAIVVPGTGAWGNAGIVDLGNQTLVFDTFGTPTAARALRQVAEEITGHPVTYALNSHRHADHVLGNIVFRDLPIVAHEVNRRLIAERTPLFLTYLREQGGDYLQALETEIATAPNEAARRDNRIQRDEIRAICNALDEIELTLPTLTFTETIRFHGSRRNAHFIHCGANHTPGDSVLWLPEDKVLLAGDIVQVRTHPSMGQGDHEHWVDSMERLAALAPHRLIPGHGEVGTGADIETMKQYLLDITHAAQNAAQESDERTLLAAETPAAYADFAYSPGWGQNLQQLTLLYKKD